MMLQFFLFSPISPGVFRTPIHAEGGGGGGGRGCPTHLTSISNMK